MCLVSEPSTVKRLFNVYRKSKTFDDVEKFIKNLHLSAKETKELTKLIWNTSPNLTGWECIARFSTEERRTLWILAHDTDEELRWLTSLEAKQQVRPYNNGKIVSKNKIYMLEDSSEVDYDLYCH